MAVRPAMEAGEDRIIRETCWARSVKVTEREKLNGVTDVYGKTRRDDGKNKMYRDTGDRKNRGETTR